MSGKRNIVVNADRVRTRLQSRETVAPALETVASLRNDLIVAPPAVTA